MGFTRVTSFNFRNLENTSLELGEKTVLFVGENGQGKTNFLELLYLLCFGSSFRTRKDTQLITHGKKEMSIQGDLVSSDGDIQRVRVLLENGKKTILLNEKKVHDRAGLLRIAPCIVFSHDDIAFVHGPPENQRTFFNQTVSICEPSFIETLRTYRRIVRMRNAALAEGRYDLLDVYDLQLEPCGLDIMTRRKETVEEFNRILTPMYREISGLEDGVRIRYRPSWPLEDGSGDVRAFLKDRRERDLERGLTTTGPHRDRFSVYMGNADFRYTASTGQSRLLSLVYRVVQAVRYLSRTGRKPVLLLDDVLLELDTGKRVRFLEHLPEYEQAFFTFLPDEPFERYRLGGRKVYTLYGGSAAAT